MARVLEYIRQHGQDSDTLNVLYVIDDNDLLIDDIRVREFVPLIISSGGNSGSQATTLAQHRSTARQKEKR